MTCQPRGAAPAAATLLLTIFLLPPTVAAQAKPAPAAAPAAPAAKRGLDPNVWFNNVEVIAAERIGAETVAYVSNIYKHYVTYRLVLEDMKRQSKKP